MQRILHIVGKMDRAGAETMLMNLYRNIDRSQFQFDFVVFSGSKGDYDDEIKALGGIIFPIPQKNPIQRMIQLKKLLLNYPEYKIVHSHTLFSSGFHLWAAKIAKVPWRIAHAHNTNYRSSKIIISSLYQYFSIKTINKYATHFIGCGIAASKFLFPNQYNVMILPNSVDTFHLAEIGEREKDYLNMEFKLDDTFLKIIQVGRLQEVKNHVFSIKIAKELKDNSILFKMFFVGQGELYEEIKETINKEDLKCEIILLGLREDIPQLMAGADVLLMPSLHEGFPVVLVESQSVGIPALIADTISPEVDLGVALVAFESLSGSVSNWVEKLVKLRKKEKFSIDKRLQVLAKQGFDIHTSTKKLADFYSSMK